MEQKILFINVGKIKEKELMDSSWSYALDMSAASGLLDYDAAARITGQKARFVGNPNMSDLDNKPLYLPKKLNFNSSSPEADEFQKESDGKGNYINNPTWKKVLTCAVVVGSIAAGIAALAMGKGKIKMPDFSKLKSKINMPKFSFPKFKMPKFKMPKFSMPKLKMPKFSGIGNAIKNGATTVWNLIKKPFVALANLIKKKP